VAQRPVEGGADIVLLRIQALQPHPLVCVLESTGTGEVLRQRKHSVVDYPGLRVRTRESGAVRAAQVAGVISDGTANYATGFTPFASLGTVNNGEVTVIR